MLPTDTFFADVDKVILEFSDADRPRLRELIDELDRIGRRVPRVAERCYAYQARLFSRLDEFEQALACVERALQLMPLDENLIILRGDIHRQAADYSQALFDYSKVLEKNPEAVTARMRRAEIRQASGNLGEALADISAALRSEPRSLRLIYRRGLILADLRRTSEAIADFRAVARLSPDAELKTKAAQRLRELGER